MRVRRAMVGAAIGLLVAALPATAHPMPGAVAGVFQMADAAWIVPEGKGEGAFYFAGAMRAVPMLPQGIATIGFVGKGRCFSHEDRNGSSTVCSGTARGHIMDTSDFEIDALLDSAHMTLQSGGFTHVIDWKGRGDLPDGSAGARIGSSGIGAGAETGRSATASGKVFGENLGPRLDVFSFMIQGALADVWLNAPVYDFHDDGRVTVRRVFRQ